MKIVVFKQALCLKELCQLYLNVYRNGNDLWQRTILLPNLIKPKPLDEVLMAATVKNVRIDGVKIKVINELVYSERTLCEVTESLLSDCIVEIDLCLTGKHSTAFLGYESCQFFLLVIRGNE